MRYWLLSKEGNGFWIARRSQWRVLTKRGGHDCLYLAAWWFRLRLGHRCDECYTKGTT